LRHYIKDDVIYHAMKFSVDSFEDCPAAPDPAAFENDGAGLDLDALGADLAGVLRRPASLVLSCGRST
jgi:hypothetical protein